MQVFLPFRDIDRCVRILDSKRLNKQIIEAYQIYSGRVPNPNHPAVLMWTPFKGLLSYYIKMACSEFYHRFQKPHSIVFRLDGNSDMTIPDWMRRSNIDAINLSHKVNLLRKDYTHYSKYFFPENSLDKYPKGYYWPIARGKTSISDSTAWINFMRGWGNARKN
jgi:hypothetical protein